MLSMTIKEFMDGAYAGDGGEDYTDCELYIVRDFSAEPIYIGISGSGIWTRWFASRSPHLIKTYYGNYVPNSAIGSEIVDNLPESLQWIIELWTLDDCKEFCHDDFINRFGDEVGESVLSRSDARDFESHMIGKLSPKMNTHNNFGPENRNAVIRIDTETIIAQEMALSKADRNPARIYLASLAEGSRPTMEDALNTIASIISDGQADAIHIDWSALRFQHTAAIRSKLAEKYSAATVNKMVSAMRGVLKRARRLELISGDDYINAIDIDRVAGSTIPTGRVIQGSEIASLLNVCVKDKNRAAGIRDAAIIALLRITGIRRAEVCSIKLSDHNRVGNQITIHGKRNKERLAYITSGALSALNDWLGIRGDEDGPMFCPINKGGYIAIRELTPVAIFNILRKRARQAGVEDISPHDMRRTFVSDLLDAGADLSTVQQLVGHSSPKTTSRYDRRGEVAKRKAVELLNVPYHSK